jgi:Undecaprenyl-phosphate glucose phosphotransferase
MRSFSGIKKWFRVLDLMAADAGEVPAALMDPSAAFACGPVVARISRWRLVAALQLAEALAVAMSACIWLRDVITEGGSRSGPFELLRFGLAVALVVHFVLRSMGAYKFGAILSARRSSLTAAAAWVVSTAPLLSWSIKLEPQDGFWHSSFLDWLTGGALIVLVRLVAGYTGTALLLARRLSHDVAIVGIGSEAQRCAQLLQSDQDGANIVSFIAVESDCACRADVAQYTNFIARLQKFVQLHHIKDVIVATSESERAQLSELVRGLLCLPVRVLLWPPSIGIEAEWIASSECRVGEMPLLLAGTPPFDGWRWVLKDLQDRTLALLLLIFCAPLLLVIAILIPLVSPGPIFFRQEREGYNGNKFVIFKFRTMGPAPPETDRLILTEKHDPRLFPLGALLRKSSLDELPQLFNVLRGDMWLIGPRPHSPLATAEGQRYSAVAKHYMARFRVKPGITGWAQVNGWRGATDTVEQIQQRVVHDLYYIENWSVWLDFQILLQTAVKGFVHQNAY